MSKAANVKNKQKAQKKRAESRNAKRRQAYKAQAGVKFKKDV